MNRKNTNSSMPTADSFFGREILDTFDDTVNTPECAPGREMDRQPPPRRSSSLRNIVSRFSGIRKKNNVYGNKVDNNSKGEEQKAESKSNLKPPSCYTCESESDHHPSQSLMNKSHHCTVASIPEWGIPEGIPMSTEVLTMNNERDSYPMSLTTRPTYYHQHSHTRRESSHSGRGLPKHSQLNRGVSSSTMGLRPEKPHRMKAPPQYSNQQRSYRRYHYFDQKAPPPSPQRQQQQQQQQLYGNFHVGPNHSPHYNEHSDRPTSRHGHLQISPPKHHERYSHGSYATRPHENRYDESSYSAGKLVAAPMKAPNHVQKSESTPLKKIQSCSSLSSQTELRVEIYPGVTQVLRGATETANAAEIGFVQGINCVICQVRFLSIANALYAICPECRVVNSVPADDEQHGVGLGFLPESAQNERSRDSLYQDQQSFRKQVYQSSRH
jgi:hypothetical protein